MPRLPGRLKDRASIYLDAYPELAYSGRVDRIWPTANRQKATIEVRIKFDQPDGQLRPEMGVRVVFGTQPAVTDGVAAEPAILVPEEAIVEVDGQRGVFVLARDTARFQELLLGESRSGRVTVHGGLRIGERIVLNPPPRLQSGDRVRIQN